MKKFLYTLMVGALLFVGCTNDMVDDVPTPKAGAKFVVDEFPLFDDSSRATVGTPDAGKSAWEEGDELLLTTTDPVLSTTLTRSANGEWVAAESLSFTPSTVITVTYAPECELVDGDITPKGEKLGTGEYFSTVATYADEVVTISFKDVERNYSRLRLAASAGKELIVIVKEFTPAGPTIKGTHSYELTTDEKGNAYLYGLFGEAGEISVHNSRTDIERTLESGTVAGQSYALDSRSRFYLAYGQDFQNTLLYYDTYMASFTKFKFVVNSDLTSGNFYNDRNDGHEEAYFIFNGDTLELHTSSDVFVGDEDCSLMFANCDSFTSIDLSGFDTSNVTNMYGMFYYCPNLVELDLSGFDTSNVTDMGGMFNDCSSLTELDLSGFDTSKVENMDSMFRNCQSLTELDLSGFDTSKVTYMGGMFDWCYDLTELDLSGFDTSNVSDMGAMFRYCNSLTELDLSGFNTSNVTDMGDMFVYCENLTELDLSGFDTSKVENMEAMFNYCYDLSILNISRFNTSKVTSMGGMFRGCSSLTELDLKSFDTSNVTNMRSMFRNCEILTELDLSHFDTSKVTDMGNMFEACRSLAELDLSSFDFEKVTYCDNMFYEFALNVATKPAPIYLSQAGKDFLTAKFGTSSDYQFVVK